MKSPFFEKFGVSVLIRGYFLIFYSISTLILSIFRIVLRSYTQTIRNFVTNISWILGFVGVGFSIYIVIMAFFVNSKKPSALVKTFAKVFLISLIVEFLGLLYPIFHIALIRNFIGVSDVLFKIGLPIGFIIIAIASLIRVFGWTKFSELSSLEKFPKLIKRGIIWIKIALILTILLSTLSALYFVIGALFLDAGLPIGSLYSKIEIIYYVGIIFFAVIIPIYHIIGHFWVGRQLQEFVPTNS